MRGGNRMRAMSLWRQLRENDERFEAIALDLLTHPDATAQQVAEVREKLIAHRAGMLDSWKRTQQAFAGAGTYVQPQPPRFIVMRRQKSTT